MNKKVYSKPDFTMMRFALSDNVAATSCENEYETLTIPCLITGSHIIFYNSCGTGNNYNDLGSSIVKVSETLYFKSSNDAIEYLSDMLDGSQDKTYQTGNYTLTAGQYLIWTSGGLTHAAYITSAVSSGINSSI